MESRSKLAMCRLCLCENEHFINVFELNDGQGYVAAEVISDLLRFQVSKTDSYPHVVCTKCLVKLTDFKLFKECCQKSKDKYDSMFDSRKNLEEIKPEMLEFVTVKAEPIFYSDNEDNISKAVGNDSELCDQDPLREASSPVTIKSEEVIIDTSSSVVSEDPLKETEVSCGPILLKYEVLPFGRNSHTQVELPLVETVMHPKYPHCLGKKRSHYTSKGEIVAGSFTCSINTNDELIFEKRENISLCEKVEASTSGTMERKELQRILPGENMDMVPLFQQEKQMVWKEQNIEKDGEASIGTCQEKGERREGLECFHCGIVLMSKFGLIRHMKVHGFGNSFDCAECGKIFHFNCDLKRHVLTHTGFKPYKCAECSKCFRQTSDLKRHMRLHAGLRPYKCAECSRTFSQSFTLKSHISLHTGSKPYKCAECSKCFRQKSNLNIHMRIHTGSKPHKCAECSKCFNQSSQLKTHMIIHTGTKSYKCAECTKTFNQSSSLKKHMRLHTGSKPYKCVECSKTFNYCSSLKVHMKLHTGCKPYKCEECSKTFSNSSNLKKHMRVHTGSKPYKCADCSKDFSHSSNLNKHMRLHRLKTI